MAMSPSSTTVHEGQYDISRVSVSWLIRAGGNPPLHKYRLHNLHILASYSPPRAENFKEGDMDTFFTGPRIGASDEYVSPPTTGHQKGKKRSGVSVGKPFFSHFCLNEATASASRHACQ